MSVSTELPAIGDQVLADLPRLVAEHNHPVMITRGGMIVTATCGCGWTERCLSRRTADLLAEDHIAASIEAPDADLLAVVDAVAEYDVHVLVEGGVLGRGAYFADCTCGWQSALFARSDDADLQAHEHARYDHGPDTVTVH